MAKSFLILFSLIYSISCSNFPFDIRNLFSQESVSFPKKNGVIMVTSETLPEALKTFPRLALFVFAPWCPHCKEMYPHVIEAAKSKEIQEMNIQFARIDADYNYEFREEFKIQGFPDIMYFVKGEKKDSINGREENEIIEWFYKRLISVTHPINKLEDIKEYDETKVQKFIYFGKDKERIKQYEELALKDDSHVFGLCSDNEIIKAYKKAPEESVILYKSFDEPNYVVIKNLTKESFDEIVNLHSMPLLIEGTIELLSYSINMQKPSVYLFRDSKDTIKTPEYDKNFKRLAEKYRGKIYFNLADFNDELLKGLIEKLNITDINRETNRPSAVIFDFNKGFNKWIFQNFFKEYTNENMEQFVKDWVDKKIVPPSKSEEMPPAEQEYGKVFKVVNKSFKRDVLDNKLNVLVKFYLPSCPHCKELEPTYIELAKEFEMHRNIRIAEFNMAENDFDLFEVNEFPKLVFFKSMEKEKPMIYDGERTVIEMRNFVLLNLGFPTLKKEFQ